MTDTNPSESDIKEIYRIYSHLSTIIHDYAIGRKLQKQKCYSWALTAYYYSLMHSGRFICYLAIKDYPKGHRELINFLSGDARYHHFTTEQITQHLKLRNINLDIDKIKKLGKILGKSKKIREDNSYELFIVAHQFKHSFLETNFTSACSLMKKIAKNYLRLCSKLLLDYVQSCHYKDYFISFIKDKNKGHKWAFNSLKVSLDNQIKDKKIVDGVFKLLNTELLNKVNTDLIIEDSFFEPISFEHYSDKNEVMHKFKQNVDNLIGEYNG